MKRPLSPQHLGVMLQDGFALHQMGKLALARQCYREIVKNDPGNADALHLLGLVAIQSNDPLEAVAMIDKAIASRPADAQAYFHRAIALKQLSKFEAALDSYDKAIELNATHAEAYFNRGNLLRERQQLDEALQSYTQAVIAKPDHAQAHLNRANLLMDLNQIDAALLGYDRAIEVRPEYAEAHHYKSFALLKSGRFAEGWKEHEWRWNNWSGTAAKEKRNLKQPLWLGEGSIAGKTILLYSEQGLGDTLQFCRYVTELEKQGAKIILEVQQSLVSLLAHSFEFARVFAKGSQLPPFDCHCSLMSLPMIFSTDLTRMVGASGYLHSEDVKIEKRREWLGKKPVPELAWCGREAAPT